MPIQNYKISQTGLSGIVPKIIYIDTNDTLAQVTATGYLNNLVAGGVQFYENDMALVSTKTVPTSPVISVGWLEVSHVGTNWSLVATGSPGSVTLPTIASHIATYTNTTGGLSEDPTTAISGGNIQAGLSGTAGLLSSFPSGAASGSLRVAAVTNAAGNFTTTISNAASVAQNQTITIPDSGTTGANILLDNSLNAQQAIYHTASATPNVVGFIAGTIDSATTITSGALVGLSGQTVITSASGGTIIGTDGRVAISGTVSGTAQISGVRGTLALVGATINGAFVSPLVSVWDSAGATTPTDLSSCYGVTVINLSTNVLGSQYYASGNATYLMKLAGLSGVGTTNYYAAAGVGAGSAGNATHCAAQMVLKVNINGTDVFIPAFTQNS